MLGFLSSWKGQTHIPVLPTRDAVMLGSLPGGNRLLHGFKYVQ